MGGVRRVIFYDSRVASILNNALILPLVLGISPCKNYLLEAVQCTVEAYVVQSYLFNINI